MENCTNFTAEENARIEELFSSSSDTARAKLAELDSNTRAALCYHFGVTDGEFHHLDETAERFGMTRESLRMAIKSLITPVCRIRRIKRMKDFL